MIEFENVSFSYEGQEHGGLHGIFSMRALIQRQYNTLPDTKTAKQLWTSMQK